MAGVKRERLVPDSQWSIFDFNEACRRHDWCYGRIWAVKRKTCDDNLLKDARKDCNSKKWTSVVADVLTIGGRLAECYSVAKTLYSGLRGTAPGSGRIKKAARNDFLEQQMKICPFRDRNKTKCEKMIKARWD